MAATVARCVSLVEAGHAAHHVSLNAAKVVSMQDDPRLAAVVRSADLVSADGQGVVWASRALGRRLPQRVAGIDLMERLVEEAATRGWPVYFLGARPEVAGQNIYEETPFGYLQVASTVLGRAVLDADRKLVWSELRRADLEAAGLDPGEVDQLIDLVRLPVPE